jgi:outer membrane protein
MKIKPSAFLLALLLSIPAGTLLNAQKKIWTLDDCIQYALEKNIQVQKALVSNSIYNQDVYLAKSARYPSLNGSVRQNFNRNNVTDNTTGSTVFKGTNGVNISASTGMTIYNGSKLRNAIKQSETNLEADKYNTEVIKETVSLNVLNAYLQVLFAEEQVKNGENQISSLTEQVNLAGERLKLGAIANSDYLQVKSQLATEKQTLATAQSQMAINRIALMQLMEYPISGDFQIEYPNLDSLINQKRTPDPVEVYQTALGIKPEVKNAELLKNSSQLSIELAKAGHYPNIALNGGVSSSYSGYQTSFSTSYKPGSFGSQLSRNVRDRKSVV